MNGIKKNGFVDLKQTHKIKYKEMECSSLLSNTQLKDYFLIKNFVEGLNNGSRDFSFQYFQTVFRQFHADLYKAKLFDIVIKSSKGRTLSTQAVLKFFTFSFYNINDGWAKHNLVLSLDSISLTRLAPINRINIETFQKANRGNIFISDQWRVAIDECFHSIMSKLR